MKWLSIVGFKHYEVSTTGVVRRVQHTRTQVSRNGNEYSVDVPAKVMEPFDNGTGYLQVNLTTTAGKRFKRYVHVLVASAFVPKPNFKCEVDHDDEDKTNNNYRNLKWVTRKANMRKMIRSNKHVLANLVQNQA